MSRHTRRAEEPRLTVDGFERTSGALGLLLLFDLGLFVVALVGWVLHFDVFRLVVGAVIVFGIFIASLILWIIYILKELMEMDGGYYE